jgi:trans-aconitate 2-methyltransferase
VDLWHTDYLHLLQGPDPVLAWTRGSVLVPLLEALDAADRGPFVEAFAARVRTAFPVDAAGRTLFWFRRLFLVARAQG